MLYPIQGFLLLVVTSLPLSTIALPIPKPEEAPQQICKRAALFGDGKLIQRGCGGDGGGDFSGGDFGGSEGDFGGGGGSGGDPGDFGGDGDGSPNQTNDIPTIEVVGHGEDSPASAPIPSGIDPELIAMNENKGLSFECALHSVIRGWEAGLACDLLEKQYGKGSTVPQPAPIPKPPPATSPKSPAPAPPPPPAPKTPAPAPKKDNSGGFRDTGRPGMVP